MITTKFNGLFVPFCFDTYRVLQIFGLTRCVLVDAFVLSNSRVAGVRSAVKFVHKFPLSLNTLSDSSTSHCSKEK